MENKTAEQLVQAYGDMIYRLAYAQTRARSDADDIFQEVFLRVVRKRPQFESAAHEKAWLLRVTINCTKSHFLRARLLLATPLDDQIAFTDPENQGLDEALGKLPAKYRAVIHLFYYEGYSAEEIAGMLGEKPSTVRTRLTRARYKLRDILKGDAEDVSRTLPQNE